MSPQIHAHLEPHNMTSSETGSLHIQLVKIRSFQIRAGSTLNDRCPYKKATQRHKVHTWRRQHVKMEAEIEVTELQAKGD